MSPHDTIVQMKFLDSGLIPPGMNVGEALNEMSLEDARKAKRKFRKMHRKARKRILALQRKKLSRKGWVKHVGHKFKVPRRPSREEAYRNMEEIVDKNLGTYGHDPSGVQKLRRQRAVNTYFHAMTEEDQV